MRVSRYQAKIALHDDLEVFQGIGSVPDRATAFALILSRNRTTVAGSLRHPPGRADLSSPAIEWDKVL
jgi:hypothetical protein